MAKKSVRKRTVRYRPGQKSKALSTISATYHLLERYPEVYEQLHQRLLRTIVRLSKKRAKKGLTPKERQELANAIMSMRNLPKKGLRTIAGRAKHISRRAMYDTRFGAFLTDAYFKERLRIEGKKHRKSAIAFIDIDRLKQINDSYGHRAGDIVIKNIGEALKEAVGELGLVGRHGGEEVLVWAPTSPEKLAEVLRNAIRIMQDRIQSDMRKAGIKFTQKATFSAGIVPVSGEEIRKNFKEAYAKALNAADKLLYRSKKAGRNAFTFVKRGKPITKRLLKGE